MEDGPIRVEDPRITLPRKKEVYSNIEALMNHFKLLMPGHGIQPPAGEVYSAVEGGNGEMGFWLVSDGTDRPWRVRVRPPCFPIMSGVEELVLGEQVADIVPIFGSVNMIGGEMDR
jgi:NADH-quinone oxidoreductase subunit D